jgi:Integrase core domain
MSTITVNQTKKATRCQNEAEPSSSFAIVSKAADDLWFYVFDCLDVFDIASSAARAKRAALRRAVFASVSRLADSWSFIACEASWSRASFSAAIVARGSSRAEAKVVIEQWRRHYNAVCPHSRLNYLKPSEFVARGSKTSDRPVKGQAVAQPLRKEHSNI